MRRITLTIALLPPFGPRENAVYQLSYYEQLSQRIGDVPVRERYDIDRHDERLRSLKLIATVLAVFYFSYTLVDIYILPDITARTLLLRFLIVGPSTVWLFAYYRCQTSIRHKELATILVACIATAVWCAVLIETENPRVLHYFYAGLIFQLVITIVITPPFEQSLYGSIFVFACLYISIWFLPDADTNYVLNHLAFGTPTVVLTLMANYRFSTESIRLYLQHIKTDQLRAELEQRNSDLEKMSNSDPLTGLANRRGLAHQTAKLMTKTVSKELYVAVAILDVDDFKSFNDHYGHANGDNCLRAISLAIRNACADSDIACRYGGEEFLVLRSAKSCTRQEALLLAEGIRIAVENLAIQHTPSRYGIVTVSIGVCVGLVDPNVALSKVISAADEALYRAKNEGRNCTREAYDNSAVNIDESALSMSKSDRSVRLKSHTQHSV